MHTSIVRYAERRITAIGTAINAKQYSLRKKKKNTKKLPIHW